MAYNKTNWENLPSTNTPINASNLNKIENALGGIEYGSNSNGKYIKIPMLGILICWGRRTFTNITGSSALGTMYRSNTLNMGQFPVSFNSVPSVTFDLAETSVEGTLIRWKDTAYTPTVTNIGRPCILKGETGTIDSATVSFIAIGTYTV